MPSPTPTPPADAGEAPTGDSNAKPGSMAEQLANQIDVPDFYPSDAPLYPDSKPSQATQAPNGRVSLFFGTSDQPDVAASVMAGAAEAQGWQIITEDQMDRGILMRAEKNGRALVILTSRMDQGTQDEVTLLAVTVDP